MEPRTVSAQAYGIVEKMVSKNGPAAGRIYVPASWVGRRAMVLLLEEPGEE